MWDNIFAVSRVEREFRIITIWLADVHGGPIFHEVALCEDDLILNPWIFGAALDQMVDELKRAVYE